MWSTLIAVFVVVIRLQLYSANHGDVSMLSKVVQSTSLPHDVHTKENVRNYDRSVSALPG